MKTQNAFIKHIEKVGKEVGFRGVLTRFEIHVLWLKYQNETVEKFKESIKIVMKKHKEED